MVGDDKCRESQDCPSIKLWFGFFLFSFFPFPEVVRFLFFHCGFFSFLLSGDPPGDLCWAFCPNPG